MTINSGNLKSHDNSDGNKIRGTFVVAVKADKTAEVTLFWNNNQKLNYVELTPGEELTLSL